MVLYIYIYEHNVDLHFDRDYVTKLRIAEC
jgi:hypothetical protein